MGGGGTEFSRGRKAIDRPNLPRCYPHHLSAPSPTTVLSTNSTVLLAVLKNKSGHLFNYEKLFISRHACP
jgi:hypothetical protein